MIVSAVISRPVQVSVLSNTYAANMAALKAIDISEMAGNTQISVAGYYTPGDGGGGTFYYDSGSSTTDNGGTIIAPNAGSGRWKRIYSGAVNVKWFGAKGDGTTDDSAAIQSAIEFCADRKGISLEGGVFACSGINLSSVAFLSLKIVGGALKYNGSDRLISFDTCTGSVSFKDVEIDGDSRSASGKLIGAVSDTDFTLEFDGCYMHDFGDETHAVGGAISVVGASGGVFGCRVENIYANSGHAIACGYGDFGVRDSSIENVDGNAIRLGYVGGGGAVAEGHSYAIDNTIIYVDDSGDSTGAYGNGVSVFQITGHRVIGNKISTVYSSGIRENQSGGKVQGNTIYDTGLVGIFHELGANKSEISGNSVTQVSTTGISVANYSSVADGFFQTVVNNNRIRKFGAATTYGERAVTASLGPGNYSSGTERSAGISMSFGRCFGNDVRNGNAGTENASCGIRTGAQSSYGPVFIGQNYCEDVDYLVGVGAATSRTYRTYVDGVRGSYRVAPIAPLGGSFAITDLNAGRGSLISITNMFCPRSLRPGTLAPGSWLIDETGGHRSVFIGDDAATGRWDDAVTVINTASQTLSRAYMDAITRFNSSSAITLTIPPDATLDLPIGSVATFVRTGSGSVTIQGGSGVTVNGTTTPANNTIVRLIKISTDLWIVY